MVLNHVGAQRAWLLGGASLLAAVAVVIGSLYYYHLDAVAAKEAQKMAEARRITALARDALWSDGPAMAILVASRVQDLGLEEAPEAERLLLTSLHGLREERLLAREHRQMVNGISYSPNGDMLVTSDPASLLFSNAKNGVPVDTIDLSYLPIKSQKFMGPFTGAQWSPGGNWIAAGSRDQTLLIAPCSHKELKNQFAACADRGRRHRTGHRRRCGPHRRGQVQRRRKMDGDRRLRNDGEAVGRTIFASAWLRRWSWAGCRAIRRPRISK